jgi:hypothetical protein
MHVCFEAPTAVSVRDGEENRSLEWIVARNAPKERAFLLLPVLAHPTGGTSDELQTHDAALFTTSRETAPDAVQECIERAWLPLAWRHLHEEADDLFECDDGGVSVLAAKRADRGTGFIVRLLVSNADGRVVALRPRAHDVQAACLCDARERDIEPLRVESGTSFVPLRSRMLTVRLVAVRSETHTAALST